MGKFMDAPREARDGSNPDPDPSGQSHLFRRGYSYGFAAAVRLMLDGVPVADIDAHAGKVEDWRDGGFRVTGEQPPVFEGGGRP